MNWKQCGSRKPKKHGGCHPRHAGWKTISLHDSARRAGFSHIKVPNFDHNHHNNKNNSNNDNDNNYNFRCAGQAPSTKRKRLDVNGSPRRGRCAKLCSLGTLLPCQGAYFPLLPARPRFPLGEPYARSSSESEEFNSDYGIHSDSLRLCEKSWKCHMLEYA